MPHEFALGGVYMTPWLIASLLGFTATLISTRLLNHYRLSKYFAHPSLVFMALIVIYSLFFDHFLMRA